MVSVYSFALYISLYVTPTLATLVDYFVQNTLLGISMGYDACSTLQWSLLW